MNNEEISKLRDFAFKLLSIRPRSVAELKNRLIQFSGKHKFDTKFYEEVLSDLVSRNYLNDEEFVKWWIEQRQDFNPKGKRFIENELINKGIDKETIRKFLEKTSEGDEIDSAMKLIIKKNRNWDGLPKDVWKRKANAYLASRGFTWDIISQVIDSTRKKE